MGVDSNSSDAVPVLGAATGAVGRARNTSWIIQSIRSRFGVRGAAKAAAGAAAAATAVSMGSMQGAPEGPAAPPWRLKRSELRKIHNNYALATEKEAAMLTVPTERERLWIPDEVRLKRAENVDAAKKANAIFLEALVADLPGDPVESVYKTGLTAAAQGSSGTGADAEGGEAEGGEAEACGRDVLEIKHYEGVRIGSQAYASMGSLLLHLFRDWSGDCEHVNRDVYTPIVHELLNRLPVRPGQAAPTVLVPGAGLLRLSYEIALKGYEVESNEFSGVFCTVADWLFNRCRKPHTVFPLAHVFGECARDSDQYLNVSVPSPLPGPAMRAAGPEVRLTMTAGDFVALYSPTSAAQGPAHRKFDCVVTCFFIDTGDDLIDYMQTIDGLLAEGGLWINLGPLNYKKELRLKLNWEEIRKVWEHMGYSFLASSQVMRARARAREGEREREGGREGGKESVCVCKIYTHAHACTHARTHVGTHARTRVLTHAHTSSQLHTAYHMPAGVKLYTEQYDAMFTTAVKGRRE